MRRHPKSKFQAVTLTVLLAVSLGLVLLGGMLLARSWKPRHYQLQMLTDLVPTRNLLARKIAEEARRQGLQVELSSKSCGALEAINLVDQPNPVDLCLVPGGVKERDYPNVRQITALMREPMHLLVRAELAEGGLAALRGKRIDLGMPTSASCAIARDILAFVGLHASASDETGDYLPIHLAPGELSAQMAGLRALQGADHETALKNLPDAVFLLAPMPSLVARELVTIGGYRLLPLPFADAYCLDRITPTGTTGIHVDRSAFSVIEIPAYTYGIDPAVPAEPCKTIASRLLLVGYAQTDPVAVSKLLETIFDGSIANLVDPLPLKDQIPQFPFHAGTEKFMHRSDPILTPEMVGSLGKAAGGLGAFASGIVAFYGFMRIRQLRRFEHYYQEIRHIELVARGQETDAAAPVDPTARRLYLEDRLLDLKSHALQEFADGGLKGEGLMSGIVSLVNDTRNSLERLAPAAGNQG